MADSNNNNQDFITREVFDANILAIREAMAASEARCEKETAKMHNEYEIVRTRLDSMDKRIDNIERSIDSLFTRLSFVFTVWTLLFTAIQYFLR